MRRLLHALPHDHLASPDAARAKAELHGAEAELRQGHVPLQRLRDALGALSRSENIAIRAPEAAHHLHLVATMLGLTG